MIKGSKWFSFWLVEGNIYWRIYMDAQGWIQHQFQNFNVVDKADLQGDNNDTARDNWSGMKIATGIFRRIRWNATKLEK